MLLINYCNGGCGASGAGTAAGISGAGGVCSVVSPDIAFLIISLKSAIGIKNPITLPNDLGTSVS